MKPTIHVVDDDEAIRDSLAWLLDAERFAICTHASAEAFLEQYEPVSPACLILDIRMSGMSGVELHEHLARQGATIPVVFVTGHGDVPMAVESIKRGAFDFIEKPFNEQKLLEIIDRAIEHDSRHTTELAQSTECAARMARLSPREREVLDLVVAGKMNKTIADVMNISIKTVEAHRARVMEKMNVRSLAELVQQVMKGRESA